jgi:subtilase family serine protease
MSSLSRRSITPLLAASLAFAALALPVTNVANAADARVVVADAGALPLRARVVAQPVNTNFDVALNSRYAAGLSSFLNALATPSSPLYRHFITPAQFAARYGASDATIHAVRSYLESFGLHVRLVTTSRTLLEMSGRTTDIARAFDTPVETVKLADGTLSAQFARSATLPAAIAHDVRAVAGLSSVVSPTSQLVSANPSSRLAAHITTALPGTCANAATSGNKGGFTVQQQAQLYGLASDWSAGKTGVGQTIAIYELGQYKSADTAVFFKCYGLSPSVTAINVDGGTNGGFSNEATMDVEAAGALAPGAALEIYQAPNLSSGPIDLYAKIANDNTASIISTSWGDCEIDPTGAVAAEQVIFQQMAAQGQTVIAAAGDSGSSDCTGVVSNAPAVDDPASQPYVTGVGGLTVSSIAPLSETVWNSNGGAGGGGVSTIWSRPSWQNANGIPASDTMRMVPDLSVMADPLTGFVNYFTDTANACQGWCSIGGTSIGAPLVSALVAVAAQVCNTSRLGFLNPTLYSLARSGKGFVDVTTGTNDLFGTGVYSAGLGYDMASGLGSPDTTFVNDLCPSPVTATRSALVSYTKTSFAQSPSHFTVALRDANGNPVTNTAVTLIVHAHVGRILIDSDPASAKARSSALYNVTSDTNGNASFTLTASLPTSVALTVKSHGTPLVTSTIVVHPVPLDLQKPVTPTVTRVTARHKGAVLSLRPRSSNTPFVAAWQVSVDGGRTWHSYPGRDTSIVLTNLRGASAYLIRVRARNGNGLSPVSRAIRITTLR